VTNPDKGGGRILGEVCHFVDLCGYLTGASVIQVSAVRSSAEADEVMVNLRLSTGGVATIAYLLGGDPQSPKERIEVFGGGAIGVIEDFRVTTLSLNGRKHKQGGRLLSGRDKGHAEEVRAFVRAVAEGAPSPIPFASAVNSTRATLAILESLESGTAVEVTSYE
jgi:predicted dehydrogenase